MKWLLLIGFLLAALASAEDYSEDCESCPCCTENPTTEELPTITFTTEGPITEGPTTTQGTTTEDFSTTQGTTTEGPCTTEGDITDSTTKSTPPVTTTPELTTTESSSSESEEEEDKFPLAEDCDVEACKLPDCRCSSTYIPGGLAPRDTPQFVVLTFDDGINIENIVTYRNLLLGRRNTNECNAAATFFVNHEYTNYQLVNELYNAGHEIGLHSITHQLPPTYWAEGTYEDMRKEFADQIIQMNHFANIPVSQFKGIRMPFLQLAGNSSFKVMSDYNLVYDLTWPTLDFQQPGLWPYTLDYASTQDCVIPPCPTASVPGIWVYPIIPWIDLNGLPCSMVDSCSIVPNHNDEDGWFRFIVSNFERHYMGNRVPFGFYVHEWFIRNNQAIYRALDRFLNMVNRLEDAFMVRADEVIDWIKDPVTIDEYKQQPCNPQPSPAICEANSCGPLFAEHNNNQYWMQICNSCPRVYPWLGNPLGQ